MLISCNLGNECSPIIYIGSGFRLEYREADEYYVLYNGDQIIAIVDECYAPEETVIEIMNDEYEVYGCRYCGTLMANSASIVVASKGTPHFEPCEDCQDYLDIRCDNIDKISCEYYNDTLL